MKIKILGLVIFFISVLFCLSFAQDQSCLDCIVIYGDSRTGHDRHQKIVDSILRLEPNIVFHVGDLVENGEDPKDWAIFNRITSQLRKTAEFYPALGNHEYESPLFFENFVLPGNERWYSIKRYSIHFIILDSNLDLGIESEQYKWLESELQSIDKSSKLTVVIFHHPPFSMSRHDREEAKYQLLSLFEKYGVDIVFNGHNHNYQRFLYRNTYYIVTGGAGAPLHNRIRTSPNNQKFIKAYHFCALSIINQQLVINVYDLNLNLIDNFSVQ